MAKNRCAGESCMIAGVDPEDFGWGGGMMRLLSHKENEWAIMFMVNVICRVNHGSQKFNRTSHVVF